MQEPKAMAAKRRLLWLIFESQAHLHSREFDFLDAGRTTRSA